MEDSVEKSCWNITFWAVTIVVLMAALVSMASNVDVADAGSERLSDQPAVMIMNEDASDS